MKLELQHNEDFNPIGTIANDHNLSIQILMPTICKDQKVASQNAEFA